eukprot:gene372-434_t
MTAIRHAGATVGILAQDGIVLAAEKKTVAKLLDSSTTQAEKMFKIDDHIVCAVAGITSDANILINFARLSSQRYYYTYQEPMPVEQLVSQICDTKQGYTQYGGLRPFGVSFLYAGWDCHYGFQLYQSDPSGNFAGWKATSIGGENSQVAQSVLRSSYKPEITLQEALQLALKVLTKTMDRSNINSDKLEFSYITRRDDKLVYHIFGAKELDTFIKSAETLNPTNSLSLVALDYKAASYRSFKDNGYEAVLVSTPLACSAYMSMVKLNIGGVKFLTTRDTLINSQSSFFAALLSGKCGNALDKDAFFVDRDGDVFTPILSFMRTGHFVVADHSPRMIARIYREADFYGIGPLIAILSPSVRAGGCHYIANVPVQSTPVTHAISKGNLLILEFQDSTVQSTKCLVATITKNKFNEVASIILAATSTDKRVHIWKITVDYVAFLATNTQSK